MSNKSAETLHLVTYRDIRANCVDPANANIFREGLKAYCSLWGIFKREAINDWNSNRLADSMANFLYLCCGMIVAFLFVPIYVLSRFTTILYPYFIVAYLTYYELWFKMDLFELCMLAFYVLLQLVLLILGIFMLRTHRWLWHIAPGQMSVKSWPKDMIPFFKKCFSLYDSIQWLPVARDILLDRFGTDIGPIIVDYIKT